MCFEDIDAVNQAEQYDLKLDPFLLKRQAWLINTVSASTEDCAN